MEPPPRHFSPAFSPTSSYTHTHPQRRPSSNASSSSTSMPPPPPPQSYSPAPPMSPKHPTSSLARRRRSSVMTGAGTGMFGSGDMNTGVFTSSAPASPSPGFAAPVAPMMGGGGGGFGGMLHGQHGGGMGGGNAMEIDPFDAISQAMTLLSLQQRGNRGHGHGNVPPRPASSTSALEDPEWPDTEELLKESVRLSLEALRSLQLVKAANTQNGTTVSENGGRQSMELMDKIREVEKAIADMKSANQMLSWAEQQAEVERREALERGLKGG